MLSTLSLLSLQLYFLLTTEFSVSNYLAIYLYYYIVGPGTLDDSLFVMFVIVTEYTHIHKSVSESDLLSIIYH